MKLFFRTMIFVLFFVGFFAFNQSNNSSNFIFNSDFCSTLSEIIFNSETTESFRKDNSNENVVILISELDCLIEKDPQITVKFSPLELLKFPTKVNLLTSSFEYTSYQNSKYNNRAPPSYI